MRKLDLLIVLIIFFSFVLSGYAYKLIEGDRVASHWNARGEVDGYMAKFWGLFLMPIITLGVYLLFLLIPLVDPLKENIDKFRKYYDSFVLILVLFFFYVSSLIIVFNLGYRFNMASLLLPAIGLLFIYMGVVMKKIKQNWFMGIRTPWTISSQEVWEKTHALGGKLFIISGVIILFGIFFPDYFLWFVLVPVLIVAIIPVVYSYIIYRKI